MRGHSHDCARAITRQNVIGNKNWNYLAIYWINSAITNKDTGLFFV